MEQKTTPAPAVRSRCESSRSLFNHKDPMPWSRGPTVLTTTPAPAPEPTVPEFVRRLS